MKAIVDLTPEVIESILRAYFTKTHPQIAWEWFDLTYQMATDSGLRVQGVSDSNATAPKHARVEDYP